MAKKNEVKKPELPQIPILNSTSQHQEIHYMGKTVTIEPGEKHILDTSKLNRAELGRVKNIFTEIVEEKKPTKKSDKPPGIPPEEPPGIPPEEPPVELPENSNDIIEPEQNQIEEEIENA